MARHVPDQQAKGPGIWYHCDPGHGLECVRFAGVPQSYPRHMHAWHWTLGFLLKGRLRLEHPGETRHLAAPGHFILAPREPHTLLIDASGMGMVWCIAPNADFKLLGRIVLQEMHGQPGRVRAMAHEALAELTARYQRWSPPAASALEATARLILASPETPRPVGQLASACGLSQWHFQRSFKKATGFTPHAFQLACRVGLARRLLRAGIAAARAATEAGFADQSHMHRVFTKHHGMTPRCFCRVSLNCRMG